MSFKELFNSFGDEFWKFINKYLFTTLFSFVFSTIVFLLTQNNNTILNSLGRNWYLIFWFAINFIAIEIVKKIYKYIHLNVQLSNTKKEIASKNFKENINFVKDLYDKLDIQSRNVFDYLVKTNNEPVGMLDDHIKYQFGNALEIRRLLTNDETIVFNPILNKTGKINRNTTIYQCKLNDELFELIKKMQKQNIKVSKF